MSKPSKAAKSNPRARVERLPSEKQNVTSKDMKKVKGGVIGTDQGIFTGSKKK